VGEIVLLWIASSAEGLALVEARAAGSELRVLRCGVRDLHTHTLASGSLAPVIAVVDDDRAATEALGAGVDEVVRQAELTDEELDRAVKRAEARAQSRARAPVKDESDALASLLDWIAIEMVACVSGAVLEGELLEESVRRLVAERTARGERSEAIPSAADTLEMLDTVRESFRRMQAVLQAVRSLSRAPDPENVALAPILMALSRIVLNRSVPVGDISVDADPRCATSLRTAKLVTALVLLTSDVFDRAVRAARPGQKRVQVILRAFIAEDAAIVEIEDDIADSVRDASGTGWRSDPIAEVRSRLRDEGADVLLSAAAGRTTVRLVLPLADAPQALTGEEWMRGDASSRPN
jgi:hypothetical protein